MDRRNDGYSKEEPKSLLRLPEQSHDTVRLSFTSVEREGGRIVKWRESHIAVQCAVLSPSHSKSSSHLHASTAAA